MSKLLYIESSPRAERSHSSAVAEVFLAAYQAAHPGDQIERLNLWTQKLPSFNGEMLNAKYSIMHGEQPSASERSAWAELETLFARFNAADKYLFSVPMWNLGLPYILKHYIDVITQPGLAWRFDPASGSYNGLVRGKVTVVYSSGGMYHPGSGAEALDMQTPAFKNWLGFIGLNDVTSITVAGTLFGPDATAQARSAGEAEAKRIAAGF